MWTIAHQPRGQLASSTMRHSLPVRDEIARIKAEHHISETSAYAMLVRTTLAEPTGRAALSKPAKVPTA